MQASQPSAVTGKQSARDQKKVRKKPEKKDPSEIIESTYGVAPLKILPKEYCPEDATEMDPKMAGELLKILNHVKDVRFTTVIIKDHCDIKASLKPLFKHTVRTLDLEKVVTRLNPDPKKRTNDESEAEAVSAVSKPTKRRKSADKADTSTISAESATVAPTAANQAVKRNPGNHDKHAAQPIDAAADNHPVEDINSTTNLLNYAVVVAKSSVDQVVALVEKGMGKGGSRTDRLNKKVSFNKLINSAEMIKGLLKDVLFTFNEEIELAGLAEAKD